MADTPGTLVGIDTPGSTNATTHAHGVGQHHHLHVHGHTGKRIRQLLRPDGRKVHIAQSPEEATTLRRTLTETNEKEDFDLVIHGSPEHVSTTMRNFQDQDGIP